MPVDYKLLQSFYLGDCENGGGDEKCKGWAAKYYCGHEKWGKYMAKNCKKACGFCGGT